MLIKLTLRSLAVHFLQPESSICVQGPTDPMNNNCLPSPWGVSSTKESRKSSHYINSSEHQPPAPLRIQTKNGMIRIYWMPDISETFLPQISWVSRSPTSNQLFEGRVGPPVEHKASDFQRKANATV